MQQQGSKNSQTGSHLKFHGAALTKGTPSSLEEFKYGFPSDGLSSASYRWWGDSNRNGGISTEGIGSEEIQGKKKSITNTMDTDVLSSAKDGDECEKETDKNDINSSGTVSLTALRKKAVKEGQEALRLGVNQRYDINKLDPSKKMVLLQIFKSSLPSEWRD